MKSLLSFLILILLLAFYIGIGVILPAWMNEQFKVNYGEECIEPVLATIQGFLSAITFLLYNAHPSILFWIFFVLTALAYLVSLLNILHFQQAIGVTASGVIWGMVAQLLLSFAFALFVVIVILQICGILNPKSQKKK